MEGPGNYSIPGSCGSFVECVREEVEQEVGGGTRRRVEVRPFHRSCEPHLAFSPHTNTCLEESLVMGCNKFRKHETLDLLHDPLMDHVCSKAPNQYMCANCKMLVNCLNGKAHPQPCQDYFCYNNYQHFGGNVCYPVEPKGCSCPDANVFYRDAYDPGAFFICSDDGERHMHHCPEGYTFDEKLVECRSASGLPSCREPGTFAFAEDCTRYYTCIVTQEGWLQHEFRCRGENELHFFNEQTGRCESPCNWKQPMFNCTEEGRFGDPLDCRRFFVCTWNTITNSFRQVLRQCPDGYEWQQVLRDGSGRCTTMVTNDCIPVTTTRCIVPRGLCST
ncbi:uncharacterized protein [Procambarus clarkii]|uniref:uncharacterized protein n=1 Tax=Procambarus clarkii TaxID=6728 RepID=UPI001E6759CD|nr:uncharacterized protein LOC123761872 [Procambarus clarkii]